MNIEVSQILQAGVKNSVHALKTKHHFALIHFSI